MGGSGETGRDERDGSRARWLRDWEMRSDPKNCFEDVTEQVRRDRRGRES